MEKERLIDFIARMIDKYGLEIDDETESRVEEN